MNQSQKMYDWHNEVQACSLCPVASICGPKITIRRNLPVSDLDILFVGEAPGASEHIIKSPFVGPAGKELDLILLEALTIPLRYNIINAVLCAPFVDSDLDQIRTPTNIEIKNCSRHLKRFVDISKPKKVVALGKVAARALKNIPHVTVLHPSAIIQANHYALEHERAVLTISQVVKEL